MKRIPVIVTSLTVTVVVVVLGFAGCKKTDNPVRYSKGTFPDTVINLSGLNSPYDDYNIGLNQLTGIIPLVFSSNRGSSGGQFDLVQGQFIYTFDQTNGNFTLEDEMTSDPFLSRLTEAANTPGNDLGPYRFFSSVDGYEYMILSSQNAGGNLDFYYTKNQPYSTTVHDVYGPYSATLLNSGANEAYLCFDANQDSAYFSSDAGGDFDIYVHPRASETNMDVWLGQDYEPSPKADSLNSQYDDKCPYIYKNMMVFVSNRPGGLGGYDIYYSVFRNGKWSKPVNFGSSVKTSSDEYRPVIGGNEDFSNLFMLFSSNRPGGKGGFDLYFTGVDYKK